MGILSLSTIIEILGSASFLIAIISGFFIYGLKRIPNVADERNLIFPLFLFLVVVTVINRLSEIFSYSASSHLEVSYLVAFILGLEIGKRLHIIFSVKNYHLVLSAICIVLFLIFSTVGILYFSHEVNAFLEAWNAKQGFKFIPSYGTGWIAECAQNLWSS
jgi:signal transduction histidine kinase